MAIYYFRNGGGQCRAGGWRFHPELHLSDARNRVCMTEKIVYFIFCFFHTPSSSSSAAGVASRSFQPANMFFSANSCFPFHVKRGCAKPSSRSLGILLNVLGNIRLPSPMSVFISLFLKQRERAGVYSDGLVQRLLCVFLCVSLLWESKRRKKKRDAQPRPQSGLLS